MSERLTIVVEGLDDESIVTELETAVRESFNDLALPGPWHVVVRPSHVGGRWDFNIKGLDVRHAMSIAVPPRLLPSLIPQRLTESLNRIVSRNVEATAQRMLTLRRVV
jgi:hypothetical protein